MTAVSNSSVLITLSSVGFLILLREKCPEGIVIPNAVWREVVEEGGNRPGAREVAAAPWIARQAPRDQRLVCWRSPRSVGFWTSSRQGREEITAGM